MDVCPSLVSPECGGLSVMWVAVESDREANEIVYGKGHIAN